MTSFMESLRQTGRSTKMLEVALCNALTGQNVIVVASTTVQIK